MPARRVLHALPIRVHSQRAPLLNGTARSSTRRDMRAPVCRLSPSVPDSGRHLTGERALERIGNILLILSRAPCESCFLRARTSLPTILRRPVKPTFAIWSLGRPQRSTRAPLLDATVPRQTSPIRDPPRLPAAGPTRHSKPCSLLLSIATFDTVVRMHILSSSDTNACSWTRCMTGLQTIYISPKPFSAASGGEAQTQNSRQSEDVHLLASIARLWASFRLPLPLARAISVDPNPASGSSPLG
ncbi:hypothetical protein IQ07DRAFT_83769 [Pyrenochaeta sp. DS3sAY3a]|nr:hypothetical protein IQ07DRAFT_83769 [Pyrenochaeta sp. DS3sAY3a]